MRSPSVRILGTARCGTVALLRRRVGWVTEYREPLYWLAPSPVKERKMSQYYLHLQPKNTTLMYIQKKFVV